MDEKELRDFWMQSLFVQYYAEPAARRRLGQWRMSSKTNNLLRSLLAVSPAYIFPSVTELPVGEETLLGRPIVLDETADGATFEVAEAVCRG